MTQQQVHKSWVQVAMMTILYCGAQYLWDFTMELFHANLLVPGIVGRFLDFWKICVPLCILSLQNNEMLTANNWAKHKGCYISYTQKEARKIQKRKRQLHVGGQDTSTEIVDFLGRLTCVV